MSYRIIIADDEPIECVALEHKISEALPDIELLPSVSDGISLLKNVAQLHPDIAIVDINMPGLNGLEAIELLKMKKTQLKIIINTSYSDFEYIQKALQLGASDYLLKPGSRQNLLKAVKKICEELDLERREEKEKKQGKELVNGLFQMAAEKWMLSLLTGTEDKYCFKILAKNRSVISDGGYFTAWKFQDAKGEQREFSEQIRTLLKNSQEFCASIGMVYQQVFYMFLMAEQKENRKEEQKTISQILNFLRKSIERENCYVSVACSRYKSDETQYINGMNEVRAVLSQIHKQGIYFFHYDTRNDNNYWIYPLLRH